MLTIGIAMLIGLCVMALAALLGLSIAFHKSRDWFGAWQEKRFQRRHALKAETFGHRLMNDSWWFSEDVPTMKLLQHIASEISENKTLSFNVSEARERWRDARVVAEGEARKVSA
jgi:hypothetical protein